MLIVQPLKSLSRKQKMTDKMANSTVVALPDLHPRIKATAKLEKRQIGNRTATNTWTNLFSGNKATLEARKF